VNGVDVVRLENRLTIIESNQSRHDEKLDGVIARLDKQNGSIARHFEDDAKWQRQHDAEHAEMRALTEGERKAFQRVKNYVLDIRTGIAVAAAALAFMRTL